MTLSPEAPYFAAVFASLPPDFGAEVEALCASSAGELVLDSLIRFVTGAECSSTSSPRTRSQWKDKQVEVRKTLDAILHPALTKRGRDDEQPEAPDAKRQKLNSDTDAETEQPADDAPLFTLHSISATSPVRKKVDITIHKNSIRLSHPTTHAIEATVPISALKRAFLLPTRGKQKPHWTVVLLSVDAPDRGKTAVASSQANPQIIFGLDALSPTASSVTSYEAAEGTKVALVKGSAVLPSLRDFLSHLPSHILPVLEPSSDVFRSACAGAGSGAGNGGVPGVEAYLGAKPGSLWFMKEGILWGEAKPCEFWPVDDLIGKTDGVRLVSATGRTCSVILTRKTAGDESTGGDEDEDLGTETEFGMIDGREQEGINQWVRQHRHLFGRKKVEDVAEDGAKNHTNGSSSALTINQLGSGDDDDDDDFEDDSESDGGSATSDSSDAEEGGETDKKEGGSGEEDSVEDGDEDGDEEEELKEENHPLLRPGAMPKMSRAAIDMVVDMVNGDMVHGKDAVASDSGEEEDELDD